MIAVIAKVLYRATGADVDVETLEILAIVCGAGLALSLVAAIILGLNLGAALFGE